MYKLYILFATLIVSIPFQCKCELKDTKTKLQAIITPIDMLYRDEINDLSRTPIRTNRFKERSNIKTKGVYITEYFSKDQVIIVDHVYEAVTNKVTKLINPYIVVIQQDEVLESYKLKHIKAVNSEVKEVVFNKESTNYYPGCYADSKRSTCHAMTAADVTPMQYSEGFCCSCKMAVNVERQMNDCQGRSRFKHVAHGVNALNEDIEIMISQMVDNLDSDNEIIANDTVGSSHTYKKQIRGGQNCESTNTPGYVDEAYRFHESSHCLKFSDLWYNVNMLESASYHHSLTISVYEKYTMDDIKPSYRKIISKVKLSNNNKNYKNDESNVQANYVALTFGDDQYYSLDINNDRLLIPEKVPSIIEHLYPQSTDDPKKYLILNANNISIKGDECNKVGVSYEAFFKQYNRCGVKKSSCLNNQPSHLWKHDMDAIESGIPGSYFLENFVKFPQSANVMEKIDGTETLNLHYELDYTSELFIHKETNYNSVLSTRSLIEIVEIYSDATKIDQTKIVAAIYNIGMKVELFRVQLLDFPLSTKKNCTEIQSHDVYIFPFHRYNHVFNFSGPLMESSINCTLRVLDKWNNVMAWRNVLISEANRCFCVWNCECACTTIEDQLFASNCKTMSQKAYNGAGFRGAVLQMRTSYPISILNIVKLTFIFVSAFFIIRFFIGTTEKYDYE
ncbi:hapless 2-like [Myzus persicae]|uniref:hapless 2-like n=1 Tax=Myzus persicae TaxID=13164 RepID=UPI000B93220A|nr:hapless 2-like [Myzus persicae]